MPCPDQGLPVGVAPAPLIRGDCSRLLKFNSHAESRTSLWYSGTRAVAWYLSPIVGPGARGYRAINLYEAPAMTPINLVVIDHNNPGVPGCAARLGDDRQLRIAARSSQVGDSGALCASYHPDVLLVSARCLADSGPGWLGDVQRQSAATRVLLIDDGLTEDELLDCLRTGVRGWIESDAAPMVGKAVHAVHRGEAWISRKLARRLVDRVIDHERGRAG